MVVVVVVVMAVVVVVAAAFINCINNLDVYVWVQTKLC